MQIAVVPPRARAPRKPTVQNVCSKRMRGSVGLRSRACACIMRTVRVSSLVIHRPRAREYKAVYDKAPGARITNTAGATTGIAASRETTATGPERPCS